MINGRTRLHVVANGTMTGQRYIDEVLLPHVRLFRGAVGDKFVFMDDNATCHRTLAVQDCLDSEGIQRLVWPARSLDLNPIENVWYALGTQVAGRNYPPTNKNTLIRALTEEWDKLPQQLLDNVVQNYYQYDNGVPMYPNNKQAPPFPQMPPQAAAPGSSKNYPKMPRNASRLMGYVPLSGPAPPIWNLLGGNKRILYVIFLLFKTVQGFQFFTTSYKNYKYKDHLRRRIQMQCDQKFLLH
ncbi:transposable element Tc3 transposase [Trichonephila clavipes]|uniref:Transposable element Tc3 transposase n=1 Tax=Trichonephila clavipes TaxID=2585209 RepID=A0A8X6WHV8_TRICX|nr:transposable element Tc3 transposase [Trichonephila clavipes]